MSPQEPNIQQKNLPTLLKDRTLLLRAGIGLFIILFLILLLIFVKNSSFINPPKAVLGDRTFTVAIADESDEQINGLSGKNNLPKDRGMLFVFEKPDYYSFWMKDMKFPIDIIFIRDKKIVKIYHNVSVPKDKEGLPVYQAPRPSDKVLEINAGLSKEYGFREGQDLEFENL